MTEITNRVVMPSEEELEQALDEAHKMRDSGNDDYFVAKALLSHDIRIHKLEKVLDAASHYLHSGLGGKEHHMLELAIKDSNDAAYRPGEPLSIDDELLI